VAVYLTQTALRYFSQTHSAYQQGVLKKGGLDITRILSDWWFNIQEGLHFTKWAEGQPTATAIAPASALVCSPALLWCLIGSSVTVLLIVAWKLAFRSAPPAREFPGRRRLLVLAGCGAALFAFSFPVFLLLDSARGLWRTQFIAGLGYGLLVVAVAGILASFVPRRLGRPVAFYALCLIPLVFGLRASIKRGELHYGLWERHRFAMEQILRVAPAVSPGSTIILTNVPKDASPFGDNMWYLVALQLAYPRTYLAGVYFHTDGSPSPSFNLKIDGSDWVWNGIGWPPAEPRRFPLTKTIIIKFSPTGTSTLLTSIPDFVPGARDWNALYDPQKTILSTPTFDYGQRRYVRRAQKK
jgi:hypothetical protein